jgi:hypothetical protein
MVALTTKGKLSDAPVLQFVGMEFVLDESVIEVWIPPKLSW